MDLIKREMDLHDPKLISDLTAKLEQPEYADAIRQNQLIYSDLSNIPPSGIEPESTV